MGRGLSGNEAVGPTHDGILLVQDDRQPGQRRRHDRGHRRIAAEPDHDAGLILRSIPQATKVPAARVRADLALPSAEPPVGVAEGTAWACLRRKGGAILQGPAVRHQFHGRTPGGQDARQCLGREQMASGSTCREQHRMAVIDAVAPHQALAP